MKPRAAYQRHPHVRLRRTHAGGAAFLPEAVTTLELDHEAFTTLALLSPGVTARDLRRRLIARCGRNVTIAAVEILLRDLAALGFVIPAPPSPRSASEVVEVTRPAATLGPPAQPAKAGFVSTEPHFNGAAHFNEAAHFNGAAVPPLEVTLPPPESIHLQLNNVCNLRCPSCYVGLQKEDVGSLPLARLIELIDEWAGMGVFQLALGGGEPLMSPNFVPVVRHARARGIVPNVTTNGWLITAKRLDEIAGSIGEIRLSLNDVVSANIPLLEEKAALLRSHGTRFGFNLIVTRPQLPSLPDRLRWTCAQGAASVTLIRPKPAPGNETWYARSALTPADSLQLARMLRELEPLFKQTALAVDCAFSFLFHGRPAEELRSLGVAGCPMGDRFAVVAWNGDVYPCSHLRGEQFCAGNVRTGSFRAIWERGAAFVRIREELPQVHGHCGECAHNPFCKGCRAVMQEQTGHWLAADHDCSLALPLIA